MESNEIEVNIIILNTDMVTVMATVMATVTDIIKSPN